MTDNLLKISYLQKEGDKVLSSDGLEYPTMPNGMANLANLRSHVAMIAEITRWAIGKLSVNDEPDRALTMAGLVELERDLNAALALKGSGGPSKPPGK